MDEYIFDDNDQPKRVPFGASMLYWAKNDDKRRVAKDKIGDVTISTVFLRLDHGFGEGKPILWETMIFGGINDHYQDRYTSKEAAVKGHKRCLEAVKKGVKIDE